MKNFLILLLTFSVFISAEEYEFEPVPNKAEYFSGKFNDGKDMQDLLSKLRKTIEKQELITI